MPALVFWFVFTIGFALLIVAVTSVPAGMDAGKVAVAGFWITVVAAIFSSAWVRVERIRAGKKEKDQ